ncbi:hypothetical protein [Sphingomonas sp. R1]|uniref:hypothetical protein n=1 Tax=Sphingomonas sp. R1 TaxID=399176 RepID=UPI002224E164|nr:hypothetical protein [Sphingomonas sp. R1]UYY77759.1 hypothetical protein OIM94_01770 [Sphingomonas sp. R1]
MSDERAREIAGKLTKAQREAMLALTLPEGGGKWPARHALREKGLLGPFPNYGFTDLAIAVRRILEEKE